MKIFRYALLVTVVVLFSGAAFADNKVPTEPLDYSLSVQQWWSFNKFNPESEKYNPDIDSPKNVIKVAQEQDIQEVINSLNQEGGTIIFEKGIYKGFGNRSRVF